MDAPRTDRKLRVLHAIHDFLPRYRAGSEIYAARLCRELSRRHHVTIVCADYNPVHSHGRLTWRLYDDVPVVEITNNWVCTTFTDTYRSPLISERLTQLLQVVQPHVVHIHNLLNLSFDLPAAAHARGIPVVATLHDYTLVCASGGQRIHRAESHVCRTIDPARCARCFMQSPFYTQAAIGPMAAAVSTSSLAAARGCDGPPIVAVAHSGGGEDNGRGPAVSGQGRGYCRTSHESASCFRPRGSVRRSITIDRGRIRRAWCRSIEGSRIRLRLRPDGAARSRAPANAPSHRLRRHACLVQGRTRSVECGPTSATGCLRTSNPWRSRRVSRIRCRSATSTQSSCQSASWARFDDADTAPCIGSSTCSSFLRSGSKTHRSSFTRRFKPACRSSAREWVESSDLITDGHNGRLYDPESRRRAGGDPPISSSTILRS